MDPLYAKRKTMASQKSGPFGNTLEAFYIIYISVKMGYQLYMMSALLNAFKLANTCLIALG